MVAPLGVAPSSQAYETRGLLFALGAINRPFTIIWITWAGGEGRAAAIPLQRFAI